MPIFETIEKPTLLLNEKIARENIVNMATRARAARVKLRPHFKTHQSLEIGGWFRTEGISAITVSSLDMAQYFAKDGWQDILLAFPVNLRQIDGLNQLAGEIRLGLLVESCESADQLVAGLRHPVDVWIKIDTGTKRTGIAWDSPGDTLHVAQRVITSPYLRFMGLLTHAGSTYSVTSAAEVRQIHQDATLHLADTRQALIDQGCKTLLLSIGDTPGCSLMEYFSPADEIRPGNFVFYDTQQLKVGACTWDQIAVALACPVVALHPERSEAVIYGGAIHLSKDYTEQNSIRQYGLVCLPEGTSWGAPLDGAYVARLSQEHGILHLTHPQLSHLKVGDLVCILPSHSCLTAQAMGSYLTLTGERIKMMRAG
jgi:D-serine deaminase-like pyridoxal phosphate-dependent protein